ncbi:PaaI family thioesterase [Pelagibius litoralis]|uniref:Medium/long-chain acyl-CoA thioesterase YigI n=1 Tax=Pelagibius litoralis TaxID=374515 RepID=A0A967C5N0_9PROT|nr:PaaI family thioesterase [Pelagibius litoralis]NIA67886.1 PaaI family thioesterase [Pelagibius litoralis]
MTDLRSPEGLQAALDRSPFQHFLGIEVEHLDLEAPRIDFRLPFQPSLARQAGDDQLHGGVLASLIDIAGDYVLAVQLGYFVPTIDLRTDYLRPSRGTVRASAEIVRCGRSVGVADVTVFDGGDRKVAVGRCLYATRTP